MAKHPHRTQHAHATPAEQGEPGSVLSGDDEQEEILILRRELANIRSSVSFQLGNLLARTAASPWREGKRLPAEMWRLVQRYRRSKRRGQPDQARDHAPKPRRYLRPGIEEHTCDAFPEAPPIRGSRSSSLRIACVVSSALKDNLEPDAHLCELNPGEWSYQLETFQPDFLIVESRWRSDGNPWSRETAKADPAELFELVQHCRDSGIPTCFWDTRDHADMNVFGTLAERVDYVLVTDKRSAGQYQSRLGEERVLQLNPAVQPALHHPFVRASEREAKSSVLMDGWADILEWPEAYTYLADLVQDGLKIIESRYRFVANKLEENSALRESILGNISYRSLPAAWRAAKVCLVSAPTLASPINQAKAAIEAAACGAVVVLHGSENPYIPADVANQVSSTDQVIETCRHLLEDEVGRRVRSLRARRILFSEHTYAHRLRSICEKIGVNFDWNEFPRVTMITPTKRPSVLENAYRNFDAQTYPNKGWLILLNSTEPVPDTVSRLIANDERTQLLRLHHENNIGVCLNVGIERSEGDYWFKMDDDDFYGPNYVSDMMLENRCVDADVFGKPTAFVYLEGEDLLLCRGGALNNECVWGTSDVPHFCGATFAGKRSSAGAVAFSEHLRASVDTDFARNCREHPLKMFLANMFDFVVLRQSDKTAHTWRAADDQLKQQSIRIGTKEDVRTYVDT